MKRIQSLFIFTFLWVIFFSAGGYTQVKNGLLLIEDKNKTYSLNGSWKFHYGDQKEWADPGYDDSHWQSIRFPAPVPAQRGKQKPGMFWYRLRFVIKNQNLRGKTFYLSLARVCHAYELYINGKKISGRGMLPDKNGNWQWGIGGYHGILDSELLDYTGSNVIAVRVYGGYRFLSGVLLDYSYLGSYSLKNNIYLLFLFLNNIISAVMIFFAMFMFFSYVHKRDYRPKIWLSFTALFFGLMNLFQWLPDRVNSADTSIYYLGMLVSAAAALLFFVLFVYTFLEKGPGKLKKILFIVYTIYLLLLIPGQFSRSISPFHFSYLLTILVSNIIISLLFYIAVRERKRKKKTSFYLIAGIIFVVAVSVTNGIFQYLNITIPPSSVLYNPFASFVFIFCIYLSIERGIAYNELKTVKRFSSKNKQKKFLSNIQQEELHSQLVELMEKNKRYRDDQLSLAALAGELSINHQRLSAFLNERYGMNFNVYINTFRINEAKDLLANHKEKSITEIAFEVGFNSLSRFYDAFKKLTGETPKVFRKI